MTALRAKIRFLAPLCIAVGAAILFAAVGDVGARVVTIRGNLEVAVDGKISPHRLPRRGTKPISVSVGWKVSTTDGTEPPRLKSAKIQINRHGILDPSGLPICPYEKIQPASTARALANCRPSLVGEGKFAAIVGLEGQEPYTAHGRMLVFNGVEKHKPVLYGHIYSTLPFANSFVITFRVKATRSGPYGTSLVATLPPTLLKWGNLTQIELHLSRTFRARGQRRTFLAASCRSPSYVKIASFHLARTTLSFVGGRRLTTTIDDYCRASG